ncbi:unnamed protein product [Orchesella dallaii]|uniref:Endothelin-converting enzyme 1 n=1 Tax=Orchesella dallaii TaxID=48710 RepID=A0ABP1RBM4_9HEXA
MFWDKSQSVKPKKFSGATPTPKVSLVAPVPPQIDFRVNPNAKVDDETLRDIFPPRKYKRSLGSLQSFVNFRHGSQDSIENLTQLIQRPSLDPSLEEHIRRHSQQPTSKPLKRGGRNRYEFAGIAHSDLDIQTSRPPLMYQMNVVEWLWLQSTIQHRLIIMMMGILFTLFLFHLAYWIRLWMTHRYLNPYVCKTKQCLNLAKRLHSSINTDVNPCENFYEFACGASAGILEEDDDKWFIGTDSNRISYNFDSSVSLGTMLKKTKEFPDSLVLEMYKACLHEKARQKSGLGGFYNLLKKLNLYHVSSSANPPLTTTDVIESMARILAQGLSTSAILNVGFDIDNSSAYLDHRLSYITAAETEILNPASLQRYGYKLYFETVKAAFEHLTELAITKAEIDIVAHDIVCIEAFIRDSYLTRQEIEVIEGKPNNQVCEIHWQWDIGVNGNPKANFGNTLNTFFDYAFLSKRLYELANPGVSPGFLHITPDRDARSDKRFMLNFEKLMTTSAPIRIMRYLQWRVLYALALELTDEVRDIMINIKRHQYHGRIPNCFQCLFSWLPFVAPDRFLKQVPNAKISQQVDNFKRMALQVQSAYAGRIKNESFSEYDQSVIGDNGPLLRAILRARAHFHMVPPVSFSRDNFPRYPKLYKGLSFKEEDHLGNLMQMGQRIFQWKAGSNYTSIFVADTSGLGFLFTGAIQERSVLAYEASSKFGGVHHEATALTADPDVGAVLDEMNVPNSKRFNLVYKLLQGIYGFINNRLQKLFDQRETWIDSGKTWDNVDFKNKQGRQKLFSILLEQSKLHIISNMVNEHLAANDGENKLRLPHLEQYDAKQLFYLTLVNRLCKKVSLKELEHRYKYGPLLQSIKTNIAFSNLKDFGESFDCPVGSSMNRADKVYFWSRS